MTNHLQDARFFFFSWKSLEAVSVCRQIRTRAALLVTHCRRQLWRQSHTKAPFTAAEAAIPFQHRCHLSRHRADTFIPGPRSQTCPRWEGPPGRGGEEKQSPALYPLNWGQILLKATHGTQGITFHVTQFCCFAGGCTAHSLGRELQFKLFFRLMTLWSSLPAPTLSMLKRRSGSKSNILTRRWSVAQSCWGSNRAPSC